MTAAETIVRFDEIRDLMKSLLPPDEEAAVIARNRQAQLTKPAGSLGRLEDMAVWLATWQGRNPPSVERPYTAVFAGNHGIAGKGVSAYPAEVTAQMVRNFIDGGAAVNQLCSLANADLRVYEMALDEPTGDMSEGPAMDEEDCARAMAYGMMAVEGGIDVLALGEMGIGNTTAAAALCCGLYGGPAADWVGPGTGIDAARMAEKARLIDQAVALHRDGLDDPLEVLRRLGGRELAAIAGAILAARMARTPVLLDGYACTAAAAVLHALDPRAIDHCLVSHVSAEPGHKHLLQRIGKEALVDLGLRLGEASGAMVAVLLLKAAVACHNGMATFAEAAVSGPGETS
ncbi:nicotinate-nucleotide--dimethylbenzimidazole phosphoribosyltransferase [Pelagibius litoralis]|uniref:Nicotinate-nucleotide--dimethylbenzimidazole phosphoribosyltransferase n=1 Tax=Pelagibius litoralis TaxID=374515 RepID=A0A967C7P6_9PROT|nr:nicotinate-nucleotide--dimethylbenzimidazole phosphoribosyltransferase [Pelagibius litoralis]NIA68097.1 nicotinate-nucleotide--dimethylbenzimidazole phosphoribosyltransferase [Pelagibius litoralis]